MGRINCPPKRKQNARSLLKISHRPARTIGSGIMEDINNFARDRPIRSSRNPNPCYKLVQMDNRPVYFRKRVSKKKNLSNYRRPSLTQKMKEVISKFLSEAAKNPTKYIARGQSVGKSGIDLKILKDALFDELQRVICEPIDKLDLERWLKNAHFSQLLKNLRKDEPSSSSTMPRANGSAAELGSKDSLPNSPIPGKITKPTNASPRSLGSTDTSGSTGTTYHTAMEFPDNQELSSASSSSTLESREPSKDLAIKENASAYQESTLNVGESFPTVLATTSTVMMPVPKPSEIQSSSNTELADGTASTTDSSVAILKSSVQAMETGEIESDEEREEGSDEFPSPTFSVLTSCQNQKVKAGTQGHGDGEDNRHAEHGLHDECQDDEPQRFPGSVVRQVETVELKSGKEPEGPDLQNPPSSLKGQVLRSSTSLYPWGMGNAIAIGNVGTLQGEPLAVNGELQQNQQQRPPDEDSQMATTPMQPEILEFYGDIRNRIRWLALHFEERIMNPGTYHVSYHVLVHLLNTFITFTDFYMTPQDPRRFHGPDQPPNT